MNINELRNDIEELKKYKKLLVLLEKEIVNEEKNLKKESLEV